MHSTSSAIFALPEALAVLVDENEGDSATKSYVASPRKLRTQKKHRTDSDSIDSAREIKRFATKDLPALSQHHTKGFTDVLLNFNSNEFKVQKRAHKLIPLNSPMDVNSDLATPMKMATLTATASQSKLHHQKRSPYRSKLVIVDPEQRQLYPSVSSALHAASVKMKKTHKLKAMTR